jgi:hypothetical protein
MENFVNQGRGPLFPRKPAFYKLPIDYESASGTLPFAGVPDILENLSVLIN